MDLSNLIKWLLLGSLLFFIILLGDTQVRWIVAGLVAVYSVISYATNYKHSSSLVHHSISYLLILWICALVGVSVFSKSLPLSLEELPLYISSVVLFFAVYKGIESAQKNNSLENIAIILTAINFVLALFHIVLVVLSPLTTQFPGVSIFYSGYGHSHVSALHVILFPISWYISFKKLHKNVFTPFLLPFVISISIILSTGRLNILLLLVQLVVLSVSQFSFLTQKKHTSKLVVFVVLISFLALSVKSTFLPQFSWCSFLGEVKICRPYSGDYRLEYWKQAVSAVTSYPLTGYGPGTFLLISQKYRELPQMSSTYAHSVVLQQFSEGGILVGGIFVVLFLTIVKISVHSLSTRGSTQKEIGSYFALGLLSAAAIGLFDYDWNLFGFLSLVSVLLAAVLATSKRKAFKNNFVSEKILGLVIIIFSGVLLVGMSLFLYSKYLQTIPYFYYHRSLVDQHSSTFYDLYKNHADVLFERISAEENGLQRAKLKDHLFEIYPWMGIYNRSTQDYLLASSPIDAASAAQKAGEFAIVVNTKHPDYISAEVTSVIATEIVTAIIQSDFDTRSPVIEQLTVAKKLDKWILDRAVSDSLFSVDLGSARDKVTLAEWALNHREWLGSHLSSAEVSYVYAIEILAKVSELDYQTFVKYLSYWQTHDPGRIHVILDNLETYLSDKLRQANMQASTDEVFAVVEQWEVINTALADSFPLGAYSDFSFFGSEIISTANALADADAVGSGKLFNLAMARRPEALYENKLWISDKAKVQKTSPKILLDYFETLDFSKTDLINVPIQLPLLAYMVASQDYPSQEEDIVQVIQKIEPDGYWEQGVLPHYYLAHGEFERAEMEYKKCLMHFNQRHLQCQNGLELATQKIASDELLSDALTALQAQKTQ